MDENLRRLENMTKISLDQLISLLNELSKEDLVEIQEIGKEVLKNSDLTPGVKSAVIGVFCVGAATVAIARKEQENAEAEEKVDPEEDDEEEWDDDQGEQR